MCAQDLSQSILRIRTAEQDFDLLQQAWHQDPAGFFTHPALQTALQRLADYYGSPLWRSDYALDEQGLLPPDLKRGVLSEDGVYNFLSELQQTLPSLPENHPQNEEPV